MGIYDYTRNKTEWKKGKMIWSNHAQKEYLALAGGVYNPETKEVEWLIPVCPVL